ncbi:MAG TPA: adenosylcobinamide-phosphate synthase CbiB [Oxalicibacterium sp.]|uniref:adenosylcobinamide-phosphate synthase CbiB n=1 Tax=Oxalicibacterium sp. TaxID=2766525 RepID=UPI002C7A1B4A|nr:adenosylcobinamide-phosphate synthase CbiB [Oxalicibacterium sp.]HWU99120.1 adenosylcobinamide-phosphate synthase CbiB [Oxalicibacterium sp.]
MLTGLTLLAIALVTAIGIALDMLFGEARRWHPLVGFGNLAACVEEKMNSGNVQFARGVLAWGVVVLPFSFAAWALTTWLAGWNVIAALAAHTLLLYFSLGLRSLREHSLPIARALAAGDLAQARLLTARIVSRDTARAEEPDLAKAGVESLLENGNDAVFGTLFWFVVAGGPGALFFRLANTLDAMWGYRTPRFLAFGCAAARMDDVLNFIPARLTALSYALLGNTRQAWHCWRTQASLWSSPNAGPVMSAGAGALDISLGGDAVYDGEVEQRPVLGAGPAVSGADIPRAWRLVASTTALWVGILCIAGVFLA